MHDSPPTPTPTPTPSPSPSPNLAPAPAPAPAPSSPERRIFIGDIQGCREELESLLDSVDFDPAADALHPVGDLVNRGPDSVGTLRLLRDLDAEAVLGNHDLHLLRVSQELRDLQPSDTFGDVLAAEDTEELCTWLANQPFLRVFDDLFMVHAGLHPEWTDPAGQLADRDPFEPDPVTDFATRVRTCSKSGERARGDVEDETFRPWFDFYRPEQHCARRVVYGHWAARGLVLEPAVRGLDTGCVWGHRLTAWIAEEDRCVHVDARRAYASIDAG